MSADTARRLQDLRAGSVSRSQTARLTDLIADVEAALDAGVSRGAILEVLRGEGFTLSLKSFESALYRIRKRLRSSSSGGLSPPPVAVVAPAATSREPDAAPSSAAALLDPRQRREQVARQFIRPESTHPLLKQLIQDRPS